MTTRLAPLLVGSWPERRLHPNEDPTYVQFEKSSHCCEGCTEGHAGGERDSSTPTTLTVAFRDDLPEGALDIEIRWDSFGKPQRLLLDSSAADALASLLRQAQVGDGAGWRADR